MTHSNSDTTIIQRRACAERGVSLIELLIALAIFLAISSIVMRAMVGMTFSQGTIANRAEMHSNIRSATEVIQQEVSQAGRIALSSAGETTTTTAAITASASAQAVNVASTAGMFNGIILVIDAGANEEVVQTTTVSSTQITAIFTKNHANSAVVRPAGSFINGILTTTNGNVLKMFGDINDNGNMVYVQYDCNPNASGSGTLTRREMPWNTPVGSIGSYPAQVLLTNLKTNPVDLVSGLAVPCFTYQTKTISWTALDGTTTLSATAALNVAVTMTGRTEFKDPQTQQYQYQTKALLTVSPRNVFQAWDMASQQASAGQHVQPTPAEITALQGAM